ncbi:MAG: hypothetical protein ACK587_06445 [Cyanobacteriota bacterium]
MIGTTLASPVRAFDLHYRQNGTSFSARELRRIFSDALPASYDQQFPERRWSTYLLLDAHADQALVAITLGLSPRVGPSQALLPVATFSVITPLPRSAARWQPLLTDVAARHARLMLGNRNQILAQPRRMSRNSGDTWAATASVSTGALRWLR